MSKNLVIVESPAKARTIKKFLGSGFEIKATYGHIRDLPKGEMGVDVKNNFKPKYIIPRKSQKNVNELKKEITKADKIYLATDPDREGEAIAWHTTQACMSDKKCAAKKTDFKRIVFYEITKKAVNNAVENPREIDSNLVDAQQARRILDRLVGYNLSPLLWKKVRKGLSAGRVQSIALKLIVDREREIEKFKPDEYWDIIANLEKQKTKENFDAKLIKKDNKKIEIKKEKEAKKVVGDLEKAEYKIKDVIKKEVKRSPAPPFITSTLQQEAARKLRFSAKKTMVVAQQLYEGIDIGEGNVGLITYMRTDSFNISDIALKETREVILAKFGKKYVLDTPRRFKARKSAQEAHEAIRPTYLKKYPDDLKNYLTPDQFKLYNLIWKRTITCQMREAIFDQVTVDITANSYLLRISGSTIKFPGFINVYLEGTAKKQEREKEEKTLPELKVKEILKLIKIIPNQKFTEPPKRYTEASLIKTLEENGIGRPSTYAPTISTIQGREYVTIVERKFYPQAIGFIVNDLLIKHFSFIINIEFTAKMEEELDKIATGELKWIPIIDDFYKPFEKELKKKEEEIKKVEFPEKKTNEKCDICGSKMVIKHGRFGEFLACSKWPDCKGSKPIIKKMGVKCPQCKKGDIIERKTKKGKVFFGCSNYPNCNFATWNKPIKTPCPKCKKLMTEGKDKSVSCIKCGYKEAKK